jgi:YidC/Oxa1 family membrane protein insertase
VDTPAVSDITSNVTDASSDIAATISQALATHTPGMLQYGDLAAMGLAGWSPAGIIRWTFELINVGTGLPWFWTIVAGSLFWRLFLVPVTVKGLQNSSRLLPIQPQIQVHQANIEKAKARKDTIALQSEAIKMQKLYKDAGVNLFAGFLVPVVQVPVSLGLFFGVKKLCTEVPQLATYSGLDILPNLAVPDPYFVLPAMLCAAINAQVIVCLRLTETLELYTDRNRPFRLEQVK